MLFFYNKIKILTFVCIDKSFLKQISFWQQFCLKLYYLALQAYIYIICSEGIIQYLIFHV